MPHALAIVTGTVVGTMVGVEFAVGVFVSAGTACTASG
jgi:hypothetical protein